MSVLSGFGDEISPEIATQIEVMGRLGIGHIELRGAQGKGVLDHNEKERMEIKRALDEAEFGVSAIGSPIGKVDVRSSFEDELERFGRALDAALFYGTRYIRVFSYYVPEGEDPWIYEKDVLKRMSVKAELAGERELVLLHENESRIFGESPDRCLRILEGVNSPALKGIFDPSNFLHRGYETYPDAWELLREHIVYFHVKDCDRKAGITVPAGQGDAGFVEILKDAHERGFDGFLSLEPHLGKGRFESMDKPERFERAAAAIREVADRAGMPLY